MHQILNKSATSWKGLLLYGKQYLGISQDDADFINEANHYRQDYTHGNAFTWEKQKLLTYIAFVESWCKRDIQLVSTNSTSELVNRQSSKNSREPISIGPKYEYTATPWYRSSCVLWLTFFMFNPLWALLILTDRSKSAALKLFVFIYYAGVIMLSMYLLKSTNSHLPVNRYTDSSTNKSITTMEASNASEKLVPIILNTQIVCQLVWEEYTNSEDLAHKNRSMVWDEIVKFRVSNTGMTARQFFDVVVERNPSLVDDGYVFQHERLYILPICK